MCVINQQVPQELGRRLGEGKWLLGKHEDLSSNLRHLPKKLVWPPQQLQPQHCRAWGWEEPFNLPPASLTAGSVRNLISWKKVELDAQYPAPASKHMYTDGIIFN